MGDRAWESFDLGSGAFSRSAFVAEEGCVCVHVCSSIPMDTDDFLVKISAMILGVS